MGIFVDTSIWFAAASQRDRGNRRAKAILGDTTGHVTSDHVLVETWLLLKSRHRKELADAFLARLLTSRVQIEIVTLADIEMARQIGIAFSDQDFSIVDRTSFAVMGRLGLACAASFDDDFAIYRYGPNREKAFEIVQ